MLKSRLYNVDEYNAHLGNSLAILKTVTYLCYFLVLCTKEMKIKSLYVEKEQCDLPVVLFVGSRNKYRW